METGTGEGASSSSPPVVVVSVSELKWMSRIGSGAHGTVYKVVHRRTGETYALKVIYGSHDDSVRNLLFCREIEIFRDLDNPNVVKWHAVFDHQDRIQVLLEYMDGGSLEGKIIRHEPSLAGLSSQILSGLFYLHRRKIVHRDIKPSNMLVNSKKQVKIANFGLSRILSQPMYSCNLSVETIAYVCPERINTDLNKGKGDGYAGDIWSLGVSILEFYMGRLPFVAARKGEWALMWEICMSQPPEAPSGDSPGFRDFIACCLQRETRLRGGLQSNFCTIRLYCKIQIMAQQGVRVTIFKCLTSYCLSSSF